MPHSGSTEDVIQVYVHSTTLLYDFFVGAMYSGEYHACDVTLSVYPPGQA